MDQTPRLALSGVVLDSPDAGALAGFYRRLLGWEVDQDEPGWVKLRSRDGGAGLSFQTEPRYVRPVWPARPGDQQMQVHLDIAVEDLAAAGEHARPCAAIVTPRRPFEPGSTRDPAVASGESRVKRGDRVAGIDTELAEKPGRDDLCPCGPGRRFPPVLPQNRPLRWLTRGLRRPRPQPVTMSASRKRSASAANVSRAAPAERPVMPLTA